MSFYFVELGEQTWEATGDQATSAWLEIGAFASAALLGVVFLVAVGRALLHQRRYRAVDVLSDADLEELRETLRAAERRTVGEILPVVVERSDPHPGAPWIAALATLLTGTVLLAGYLPWGQAGWLLSCQFALGALGWVSARALPGFLRLFVSEERATRVAAEQAFQEFYRNGLHETEAHTGVLLFVSLLERRAIVLGDSGIDAVVSPEDWAKTNRALLTGVRRGDLCAGLRAGIESAAELLAEHFPWTDGDRNEIPDRVIVRRE